MSIRKLRKLSKKDLLEVYNNLNNFRWDDRLGREPRGFSKLPNYSNEGLLCKYRFLKPYMITIRELCSEEERFKHHHIKNLNKNYIQFKWWWIKRIIRVKIFRQPF